jgi:hypothetical protein
MKRFWITLVAAGLLAIAAIGPAAAQDTVDVDLDEVDGSGVTGTATLSADNGQTTVSIEIEGGPEGGVHPVHIHDGTCEDLGGVAYPLDDIEDSMSETTVDVALEDLLAGEYAINIHLSADDMATWVACGNLPSAPAEEDDAAEEEDDATEADDEAATDDDEADDAEDVMPAAGSTGGINTETATMMLVLLGSAALGAGIMLRRRFAHQA